MLEKSIRLFSLILLAALVPPPAVGYEVHYLSVGNASYRDEAIAIPDANTSARQVGLLLRRMGAKGGVTLLSEAGGYVTANDVRDALDDVARAAARERDPLVVYYFIGHGRTAEPGGVHVSLTGAYGGGDTTDATSRIETDELRGMLEERSLPYVLILDNCYYRKPIGAIGELGRAVSDQAFGAALAIDALGTQPKERQPQVAVFAASRGEVTQTLPHPESEGYSIGPLARRLLLLLDAPPKDGLSVRAWLAQMNHPAFDPQSVPGHVDATIDAPNAKLVPAAWPSTPIEATVRQGSAGG